MLSKTQKITWYRWSENPILLAFWCFNFLGVVPKNIKDCGDADFLPTSYLIPSFSAILGCTIFCVYYRLLSISRVSYTIWYGITNMTHPSYLLPRRKACSANVNITFSCIQPSTSSDAAADPGMTPRGAMRRLYFMFLAPLLSKYSGSATELFAFNPSSHRRLFFFSFAYLHA